MAPTRHTRRSQAQPDTESIQDDLFLEPMMGSPLAIYIEKDVPDRDPIVELVTVRALLFDQHHNS